MAKLSILKGATSILIRVLIQDTSKTNGAGLAGLTNASSGLTCYVARDDDGNANATQLSLAAGTRGTWSSGGFKEKDATNQPGVYELGLSNASLATGSRSCTYYLQGAANMAPCVFEIELTNIDNQSTTFGLAALTISGTSALTESYASLHGAQTLAQILYEMRALLAENSISSTTLTTKKIDGSTTAHTYTLDSATAPTSITTAS